MEQFITFIVQRWDARYDLWIDITESGEGMFDLPTADWATEAEAAAKLLVCKSRDADGTYRVIKRTVTIEVCG